MFLLWPNRSAEPVPTEALRDLYAPANRGIPALRVNFVTSLDGADSLDGFSAGLSGPADKLVFGLLRTLCDALLVGAGTLRTERYGALRLGDQRRAVRRELGLTPDPPLVILSERLALAPEHPVFAEAPVRPIILTHENSPADRRAALAAVAEVLVAGRATVDLAAGIALLHARGLRQVLCEGGPRVLGSLTAADLVDDLCLTVSPLLTGAGPGRLTRGPASPKPRNLTLRHVLTADGVLLLRYTRPTGQ